MEKIPLEFVERLNDELAATLRSMHGFEPQTLDQGYRFFGASHLLDSARGYHLLCAAGQERASYQLIRPAWEIMVKLVAIRQKPEVMYWLGLSETNQDEQWMKSSLPEKYKDDGAEAAFEKRREEFIKFYQAQYPHHVLPPLPNGRLSTAALAKIANLMPSYIAHYSIYSGLSHGSLRAMRREAQYDADPHFTMAFCLHEALRSLEIIGFSSPNKAAVAAEFQRLIK